ncbi:MAG: hypothetical protein ACI4UE_00675 [Candidatus Scatovivens sp.]
MINSDFDTIIRNDNNFKGNRKSKLKTIIIIFVILILISSCALGYFYYSQYKAKLPKMKFFEYVSDSNLDKIFDTNLIKSILDKISTTSCTSESNLSLNSTNEELDISKLNIDLNYSKNEDKLSKTELIFNNSENELIKYTLINDTKNIGVKSDDIVIKYVGSKIENLDSLKKKIMAIESNVEEETIDNGTSIEIPNKIAFDKYKDLVNSKLLDDKFSIEDNVLLTQNGTSIETTLYELSLSKEDVLQIFTELKKQLLNDDELIGCFITGKELTDQSPTNALKLINGYKADFTFEQAKEYIEKIFSEEYDNISRLDNFVFNFDIYVNGDKVVKKSINCGEYLEIELENEVKSENENYAKITIINKDDNDKKNGVSFNINRLDNNVSTIISSELSIIENMEINNKITVNMTLEGNESSTNLNNKLSLTFTNTNTQISANLNTKVEFGFNEQIESLNNENCLFLDELDNETLKEVIDQIENKTNEVMKEKFEKIYEDELEEPSNSSLLNMDNIANNAMHNTTENTNEEELKEEAKQKLITAISNAMVEAEADNREYALTDLQNLQIEGSTLSVMVGENMAVIALDGYTFYIDPNFVLTTE